LREFKDAAPAQPEAARPAKDEPSPPKSEAPPKPKMPPEARRDSAPEALAGSALAVGAMAPALAAIPSTRGDWSRGEKITVLAFYRGHW
jgi:hypothetical protein